MLDIPCPGLVDVTDSIPDHRVIKSLYQRVWLLEAYVVMS